MNKKPIKKVRAMDRFSFAQMTSNGNGKTSASGTMGVLVVTTGTLAFILGVIDKMFFSDDVDIITQTIVFTGIGASLLGLRKYKAETNGTTIELDNNQNTYEIMNTNTPETYPCGCPVGCTCGNCQDCTPNS
jgi:hypothetical protein